MKQKYYASVSFGKDSLAMLLMIIEKCLPLDEVVFYDTGMEFQAIYDTRDKILPMLAERGIKYTELYPTIPFLTKMFDITVKARTGGTHKGYSWCGSCGCRWGTTDKLAVLKKYIGNNFDYVGIAIDETNRIEKEQRQNRILFLVEQGITEQMALDYCYSKGFFWVENGIKLYDVFDRVSCYCCGNKNNWELINMYHHLPNYFEKLKDLEKRNRLNFRGDKSIFDIEKKIANNTLRFIRRKTLQP
jgi:3'-phosphoadenosine 5'-phosphosulfate sulfotransferase (PAPS reductase)/FAD synthetase